MRAEFNLCTGVEMHGNNVRLSSFGPSFFLIKDPKAQAREGAIQPGTDGAVGTLRIVVRQYGVGGNRPIRNRSFTRHTTLKSRFWACGAAFMRESHGYRVDKPQR